MSTMNTSPNKLSDRITNKKQTKNDYETNDIANKSVSVYIILQAKILKSRNPSINRDEEKNRKTCQKLVFIPVKFVKSNISSKKILNATIVVNINASSSKNLEKTIKIAEKNDKLQKVKYEQIVLPNRTKRPSITQKTKEKPKISLNKTMTEKRLKQVIVSENKKILSTTNTEKEEETYKKVIKNEEFSPKISLKKDVKDKDEKQDIFKGNSKDNKGKSDHNFTEIKKYVENEDLKKHLDRNLLPLKSRGNFQELKFTNKIGKFFAIFSNSK